MRASRSARVEANRGEVLGAARRVFLARGYAGATLDAIADAAGFSKGVVYSQFGGKADLFLALLAQRIEERAAQLRALAERHRGVDGLRALLRAARRDSEAEAGWGLLLLEFRLRGAQSKLNALRRGTQRTLQGIAVRAHVRRGRPDAPGAASPARGADAGLRQWRAARARGGPARVLAGERARGGGPRTGPARRGVRRAT
jgi:AcrR family transcriptional regulator